MILFHSIARDVRVKGYQCSFFYCKGSGRVWVILPLVLFAFFGGLIAGAVRR